MPRRPTQPMPEDIAHRLEREGLAEDYADRPFYQRNDYLGWIARARRPETRARRVEQMIDELRRGGVYMKMDHPPSRKTKS